MTGKSRSSNSADVCLSYSKAHCMHAFADVIQSSNLILFCSYAHYRINRPIPYLTISFAPHYFSHEILLQNMFSNNLSYKCTDSCKIFGFSSRHSPPNWSKLFQDFIFKNTNKRQGFHFLLLGIVIILKKKNIIEVAKKEVVFHKL